MSPYEALKRNAARLFRRAASRSQCFLLRLALSLFGQIEVFLDNLGRFIGEILYVGVTPVLCLCLKFGKVFFVVIDHHIHVGFIRAPFFSWLFARQFNAFLLSD